MPRMNPILIKYLKKMLLERYKITDHTFEDIDCWMKVLGKKTNCANCKKQLPFDWKCCEYCMDCVCEDCQTCYDCLIKITIQEEMDRQADQCVGCGAPDACGLCYDCRHDPY